MTTLSADQQQRREEQHLVGLEFSAPCPPIKPDRTSSETLPGRPITIAVSGQQSSVGLGRRHQLRRPGQPAFPAASPSPRRPTDDCSLLTAARRQRTAVATSPARTVAHFLLEPPSALRVVAEHVEARARRREQHDARRLRQRERRVDRVARAMPPRAPSTDARQRFAHQRPRFADRDHRLRARRAAARAAAADRRP